MGKKGKKKKKSAEEKAAEAAAAAEAERLAAEAEAARLEELRKRREAAEQARREELARLRAAELARLRGEEAARAPYLGERRTASEAAMAARAEGDEWTKYLACSRRPDPAQESNLNTYLNEWAEEDGTDLGENMAKCQETLAVVSALEDMEAGARARGDQDKAAYCARFVGALRNACTDKMDFASAHILQHADDFASVKNEVLVSNATDDLKVGLWVNLASKGFRMKTIEYPQLDITTDVPKGLALQAIAVRVTYTSYDNVTGGSGGGSAADMALGGVLYIELLALPPPCKKVKGWTLRHVTPLSKTVQRLTYPLGGHSGDGGGPAIPASGSAQALRVRYTLPKHVIVQADPQPRIGWWDAHRRCWSEEGIENVNYDPDTRLLSFHTVCLTAMAVLQSRQVDLPYTTWSLKPTGAASAEMQLETARHLVTIGVGEGTCTLLAPLEPELDHLRGRPMEPGLLLTQLARSGIVITPTDGDASRCGHIGGVKAAAFEASLHEDLCSIAAAFALCGSSLNQARGAGKAVFKLKEMLDYEADPLQDTSSFTSVLFEADEEVPNGVKCSLLPAAAANEATGGAVKAAPAPAAEGEGKEGEEKCGDGEGKEDEGFELPPIEDKPETHAYLRLALEGSASDDALQRNEGSSLTFQQTVKQLFNLIRPFSFC